jgi:c-di-GMP-binding flagellar brake protein YcgR
MGTPRQTGARRRAPRLAIQLEGRLAGRLPHDVKVVDLSVTGCLIRCDALLNHGAILDLEMRLGPDPLGARVRVAESYLDGDRTDGQTGRYLAGLEFLGLPPREAAQLRRFLDEERRRRQRADPRPD